MQEAKTSKNALSVASKVVGTVTGGMGADRLANWVQVRLMAASEVVYVSSAQSTRNEPLLLYFARNAPELSNFKLRILSRKAGRRKATGDTGKDSRLEPASEKVEDNTHVVVSFTFQ